jgi:hypothetical protein
MPMRGEDALLQMSFRRCSALVRRQPIYDWHGLPTVREDAIDA